MQPHLRKDDDCVDTLVARQGLSSTSSNLRRCKDVIYIGASETGSSGSVATWARAAAA